MNKEKIKQWFGDYLDFAIPLIMIIGTLELIYSYDKDFSTYGASLSTLIFLGSALILRLFTNRLNEIFIVPYKYIFIVCFVYFGIINNDAYKESFVEFLLIWFAIILFAMIVFVLFYISYKFLRIFFANFPKIKNISYISIFTLWLLILLMHQLDMSNVFLMLRQISLIAMCSLITISVLYYVMFSVLCFFNKNVVIIKPRDIIEWDIDIKLEAEAAREAEQERRERKRIIDDIASAVRKRL